MNQSVVVDFPLSRRLKSATVEAHAFLDARIMAAQPFATRERYGRFLRMQHRFHREIAEVYADTQIVAILPDLASRCRLAKIEADLADLDMEATPGHGERSAPQGLCERLGWLYVAEGSNQGAAFLIKEAAKLGFGPEFGARHLAGHPDGRGLQWRRFQEAVDTARLSESEQAAAVAGANAAFMRVRALADDVFGA